jgi:hypothetical protein
MKKIIFLVYAALSFVLVKAQNIADMAKNGSVTVVKDPRLDILAKKQAEFNQTVVGYGTKATKGYRLMVLSSNDRNLAMKVRANLLQNFPEQKVYMSFQAPFIKLKFGNFAEKSEAERYKRMILSSKIVSNAVYVVPEIIEVKPDKNKENDDN